MSYVASFLAVMALVASADVAVAQTSATITPEQAAARSADEAGANAAATTGAFAIGTPVLDGGGQSVGRITRLTTGKDGQTLVMVRKGVDSFSVPASSLRMQNGAAVGSASLGQMKALGAASGH